MTNDHPTLLRAPAWYSGTWKENEWPLPGDPEDYEVRQVAADRWEVTAGQGGDRVYWGIGPVEVIRSPAPF